MSDPKQSLQEANGFLRTAERNMFNGKNDDAVELLKKAEESGKAASQGLPNDVSVKTLFNKIEKMKKDLERKGVRFSPQGNNELPFEVQSHLSRIRALLISVPQQPYLLDQAKSELKSYYSRFAGPMTDIPEIKEINEHISRLEKELAEKKLVEENEKAQKEKQKENDEQFSNQWYEKLRALQYFDGNAADISILLQHKETYYNAFEMLREFDALSFTGQKSLMLENIENDLRMRIKNFQSNFNTSASNIADVVKQKITSKLDFLKNDTAWQTDEKIMPYYIDKRDIEEIRKNIEELKPLDESVMVTNAITALFEQLVELNESRKTAKKEKIHLKSDIPGIADSEVIKEKAGSIVADKYPSAKIKKVNVTKEWEYKQTEDWEDTSRTKWIVKQVYESVAQAAVILDGNICKLLTLHIEKPKEGVTLSGHIMYEDDMLEKNIV